MSLAFRLLVVVAFVLSVIETRSQSWQRDSLMTLSYCQGGLATGGPRSLLHLDTCTGRIYAFTGNRVLVSINEGHSWSSLEMPDVGKDYYSTLQFSTAGCKVVAYWEDKVGANVFRMVYLDQNGWKEIRPDTNAEWGEGGYWVAARGQSILVDPRSGDNTDSILVSLDLGETWTSHYIGSDNSFNGEYVYDVNSSFMGIQANDSNVYEFDVQTGAVTKLSTPKHTKAHSRIGVAGVVASVLPTNANARIGISNDDGKTWQLHDTLRFVNSDTILESKTRRNQFEVAWWLVASSGDLLMGFSSGAVVSVAPDLTTWKYLGRISGGVNLRTIIRMNNGNIILVTERGRVVIDANMDMKMTLTQLPRFVDVVKTLAGTFVGIAGNSLYYSLDSGKIWVLTAPVPELLDVRNDPFVGYHWPAIERIAKVSIDTTVIVSQDHGAFFSRTGNEPWAYTLDASALGSGWPYLQFADIANDRGKLVHCESNGFVRRSSSAIRFSDRDGNSREIYHPTDYNNEISSCARLSDSTYFVLDRTLQRSTDDGRTWITCGAGWPRTSEGSLAPFLSAIRLRSGTLIFTLAGRREIVDGDSIVAYPGGVLISDDNGQRVEQITTASLGNMFVHSALELDDDKVLLSMSNIARQTGTTSWDQTNAYVAIMKLSDRSTTYPFVESRTAPLTRGTMPIKRIASGDILVGTTQSGVVRSEDNGQTWKADPEETLLGVPILDIAQDPTGVLYVATDRGLFTQAIVSDVTVVEMGSTYASVWCYPTPTQDFVTVRLNNLNLVESANLRLEVIDISGQRVLDLSDWARTARGISRIEFPLMVQNLPRGLYYFILSHTKARESFPMMIVH